MSTRMHNFRIAKSQWWDFAEAAKEFCLREHPMMEAMELIAKRAQEKDVSVYRATSKFADAITPNWTLDLQLFDEFDAGNSHRDTYLVRPLEAGWFFKNSLDDIARLGNVSVEAVNYNNSTDVPLEEEKNKEIAEWVDVMIDKRKYLIFPLLTREDFMSQAVVALFKEAKAGE